jgi:hypothetical protein
MHHAQNRELNIHFKRVRENVEKVQRKKRLLHTLERTVEVTDVRLIRRARRSIRTRPKETKGNA